MIRRKLRGRFRLSDPKVGGSIAGVLFILATVIVILGLGDDADPVQTTMWFYDLNTNEQFVADIQLAPIRAPSDPVDASKLNGVEGVVFGCGSCDDESKHFIGFLRQFTDEYKTLTMQGTDTANRGMRVRAVDGTEWWEIMSPQGEAVLKISQKRCFDQKKRLISCRAPM